MRITVPNPFGPPVSLDTALLPSTGKVYSVLPASLTSRRAPVRWVILLALLGLLWNFGPAALPPSYNKQWAIEAGLPWIVSGTFPEGMDGRYVL